MAQEATEQAAAATPMEQEAAAAHTDASPADVWQPGQRVRLVGLTQQAELNGAEATLLICRMSRQCR